jgi:hypothetical protein
MRKSQLTNKTRQSSTPNWPSAQGIFYSIVSASPPSYCSIRLMNNLIAPGTPAGNCLKNEIPV